LFLFLFFFFSTSKKPQWKWNPSSIVIRFQYLFLFSTQIYSKVIHLGASHTLAQMQNNSYKKGLRK
jgi:hypothetical protein